MESSGTHKSYDAGDRVDTVLITCGPGTKPCHRITGCRRGLLQYLADLAEFTTLPKEITICSKQQLQHGGHHSRPEPKLSVESISFNVPRTL